MSRSTLLTGLRIWDGDSLAEADCLRIRRGRIDAIDVGLRPLAGEVLMPCGGATALPGLIDAHVHLELNPEHTRPPSRHDARDLSAMAARARDMAGAGITTARDLGGGVWAELLIRDRIAAGALIGPRLLCAGQPVTRIGGHCHFWGGEAGDAPGARAVVLRQVSQGVDLIKVMATGGMFTRGTDPAAAALDLDMLRTVVEAAGAHGLPVAAHCHGTRGIELAARAGVATIEHCSWMGERGWAGNYEDAVARLMLERRIWVSPTVNSGWRRYLESPDPTKLNRIRAAFQAMLDLGIGFVASTDAGIPGVFHHHLPQALGVFQRIAERSAEEVLRTATSAAAVALGLGGVTGRLTPGLAADVLLVDGDPLTDLTALTRPLAVWAAGHAVRLPD